MSKSRTPDPAPGPEALPQPVWERGFENKGWRAMRQMFIGAAFAAAFSGCGGNGGSSAAPQTPYQKICRFALDIDIQCMKGSLPDNTAQAAAYLSGLSPAVTAFFDCKRRPRAEIKNKLKEISDASSAEIQNEIRIKGAYSGFQHDSLSRDYPLTVEWADRWSGGGDESLTNFKRAKCGAEPQIQDWRKDIKCFIKLLEDSKQKICAKGEWE